MFLLRSFSRYFRSGCVFAFLAVFVCSFFICLPQSVARDLQDPSALAEELMKALTEYEGSIITQELCEEIVQTVTENDGDDWPYGYYWCTCDAQGNPTCAYNRDYSCFPPETRILMADQSMKRIDQIREGDMVWNPVRGKAMRVGNRLAGPEAKPLIEIGLGSNTVIVTETHPMLTRSGPLMSLHRTSLNSSEPSGMLSDVKIKKAMDITPQDWILNGDGQFHQVSSVRVLPLEPGQVVWNFELDTDSTLLEDHVIVAEGIATGDVSIQAKINGYKLPWEKR